ncbi:protein kinase [Kitasatospora phosalacinea]|uniref:serine/threonine protein kinase n=1 Tax=Kitasatospora phosalacinea TaxID=2065 RepID=UPI00365E9700
MTLHGGTGGTRFDLAGSGAGPLEDDDPRAIGEIPLLGRLGAGGMGRVYLGVVEGRYAAVKQVLPQFIEDPDFQRHFGHELDNLARLPEEATAPLLAADRDARPPWLATAYVPGLTLDRVLAVNGGPLDAARLWLLLRGTAACLRAVHGLDMIHRDLKPSNVMLTAHGVTLIDFGIARAADQSRLTRTGMVLGTPSYMAPEQANNTGRFTPAVDVFALGALIAYAATGRPPFGEGSGVDMLYRIVHTEPDLAALHELDPDLAETVAACLDKNPTARPTAGRLVQLAAQHSPVGTETAGDVGAVGAGGSAGDVGAVGARREADWPEPVMGALLARSAFAEQAAPAPAPPAPAPPDGEPTGSPTRALRVTGPEPKPERAWYRRLVPLVVPVVLVAGATTAVQLLPYDSPNGTRAASQPPSSTDPAGSAGPAEAPTAGSPTPSDTPATTSPPAAASQEPGTGTSPGGADNGRDGNGSPAGATATRKSGSTPPPTPEPTPKPSPTPPPARTYGPRCVFTTAPSCTSDDPTVELTSTGGWTDCTFTFTTDWGDGNTTYTDTNGTGSTDVRKTYATHRYAAPGTYRINVRAVTDSGFCLATGANLTFTLTP